MKKNTLKNMSKPKPSVTRFSFKSAFFILFTILCSSLLVPTILDSLGLELLYLRVILISLASAFSFSYSLYVIERKEKINKNFWIFFALIAVFTSLIAYYWVFEIYYI